MKKKIENLHKSKRFRISYQVIFIFLALYSFVTTILDLHGDISIFNNPILEFVDVSIYLILQPIILSALHIQTINLIL